MPWNDQSGGGWKGGGGGGGPWGSPPQPPRGNGGGGGGFRGGQQPPNLEDLLRRSQDRLRTSMPGGTLGPKGIAIGLVVLLLIWLATGIYRVQEGFQGVELTFGDYTSATGAGLAYHWPAPIGDVETVNVEGIRRIDVGLREGGGRNGSRDVPEESLMLTGDENIVDIEFTVLWKIQRDGDGASKYLFNIDDPESTVRAVAESAMREVIGESTLQPILTENRGPIEEAVQTLIQDTLNAYNAGIEITQVQLQDVGPPNEVVDAFRDVQAAVQDQERVQDEARAVANRVIPEARGEAARLLQAAEAYREQTVAEASGQADRFLSIYEEYREAPEVTRQRLFLETMERVFADMDKTIIDNDIGGQGVVPYLPLDQVQRNRAGTQ